MAEFSEEHIVSNGWPDLMAVVKFDDAQCERE